ncbi:phenylalanine--tRNA ligase subunit beta [Candidatus Woesearchaeota archaeon]|nr:phenylalanine--tRNA ligase subunit beta [Candidatus Woesearchaeota archaeon]
MPTITFSFKDFTTLLGKKISTQQFKELLEYAKAELEQTDGDNVSVKFNDTNQPYLWSAEGIATLLRGVIGKEKGVPKLNIKKSNKRIIVDKSVNSVRPHIAAFIAQGPPITEYLLNQIIQLQEKICDNYGKKREKIAVGIYPATNITFPVTYKAVKPESVKFVPLGWHEEQTLSQIILSHQKGKEYGKLLEKATNYPILIDTKNEILSFPPIINSDTMGNLKPGDTHIFFETTGTDERATDLAAIIFAHVLSMRGYTIFSVTITEGNRKIETPQTKTITTKINKQDIKKLLGIELKDTEIKKLLEKARYNIKEQTVEVPSYRQDIMHQVDIIEDIAIMHGYNNIESATITTFTRGAATQNTIFINACRQLLVGQGYQEIFSPILSNKTTMQDNMRTKEQMIEIENFTSQTYSAVRTSILPTLLEVLSKNKHVDYPQKIFEQGIVTKRNGNMIIDQQFIAITLSHATANFTEIRQTATTILSQLGMHDFQIKETEHPSFITGRAVNILVNNENIGIFGEIHPEVLSSFGIEMPVAAAEINIDKLQQAQKK